MNVQNPCVCKISVQAESTIESRIQYLQKVKSVVADKVRLFYVSKYYVVLLIAEYIIYLKYCLYILLWSSIIV